MSQKVTICLLSVKEAKKINWNLCYYSTKYVTHFIYRFVSPPVKYSFNLENKDKDHGSEDEIKRREGGSKANLAVHC